MKKKPPLLELFEFRYKMVLTNIARKSKFDFKSKSYLERQALYDNLCLYPVVIAVSRI